MWDKDGKPLWEYWNENPTFVPVSRLFLKREF